LTLGSRSGKAPRDRRERTVVNYLTLTVEDAKRYISEGEDGRIRTRTVLMPRETAQYLLTEVNSDNFRDPINERIKVYLQMAKDNLWLPGVADISVGMDGVLDNGQHVLAVIAHDYPQVVRFTVGMPVGAEDAYDTGSMRTARAVMMHHNLSGDTSAILRQYLPLKEGNFGATIPPIPAPRIMKAWDENPWVQENIEEARAAAAVLYDVTHVSKPITAAIYLLIKSHDPDGVVEYFKGLCGIVGVDPRDPRHFTMRSLQSSKILRLEGRKRAPGASQEIKEKIFLMKGYNSWAAGEMAVYAFDDPSKPKEGVAFPDGSAMPERGLKMPPLFTKETE
jgi:hypothetical protein